MVRLKSLATVAAQVTEVKRYLDSVVLRDADRELGLQKLTFQARSTSETYPPSRIYGTELKLLFRTLNVVIVTRFKSITGMSTQNLEN